MEIIKLLISKGANKLVTTWETCVENIELYKLYVEKTGYINKEHYQKLVCFYDPVYVILTQKKK